MTNLSQLIVLLQFVGALLTNSSTAQNQNVQALAIQAIGLAQQAVQTAQASDTTFQVEPHATITYQVPQNATPTISVVTSTSQIIPPLEAVPQTPVLSAAMPTCNLSAESYKGGTRFTWDDSSTPTLWMWSGEHDSDQMIWHIIPTGDLSNTTGTDTGAAFVLGYKAHFTDGATCYAWIQNGQSTSVNPFPETP